MNRYDEAFDFRIANITDVENIMQFLKEEWAADHILSNDKDFFLWQYGNEQYGDSETINVTLMLDKKQKIVGINGFIAYSACIEERYVSSAITKVKNNLELPLCGVELIRRFKQLVPAKAYYSSGTNQKTMLPIGKKIFHYTTGVMQQFYILNPKIVSYKIAKVYHQIPMNIEITGNRLEEVFHIEQLEEGFPLKKSFSGQGFKSKEFLKKRYFKHPIYKYRIWGIREKTGSGYGGILIGREIQVEDHKVLRFVDYLGEIRNLGRIGDALQELVEKNGYEYIDMLAGELPKDIMSKSGFALRTPEDSNIIPTYFEPFVRENVDICYQKSDPEIVIFKADGDQDRPNRRG